VSAKPGSLLFSSSDQFANFAPTNSPEHRNSGSQGTHARSISCSKNVRLDEQNATTVMRVVEREGLGNDERSKECSQGTSSTIVIYEPSARRRFSNMRHKRRKCECYICAIVQIVQYFLKRTLTFLNYYPIVPNLVNTWRLPKCQSN
jgi:type IV secretory pathway VirJ component